MPVMSVDDLSRPADAAHTETAILADAGIAVQPVGRVYHVMSDGLTIAWAFNSDEAETIAYELATALIAEGLTGPIVAEMDWM